MSRLSKIIDHDASKRFDRDFNPDEIGLMLENFYFNEMRNELFQEYMVLPNEETIKKTVSKFEKKEIELTQPISRQSLYELKGEAFTKALAKIKELLKQEDDDNDNVG